ncbi:EamA family transporter [Aeromicrobium sp. REDSEA-S38_B2]|uniref:EamA family transporter n=1 Tax=Aeromicrobium sp. REDSEA-S38_B2 TaxID=1811528 RepID=UPI000A7D5C94|nr:EamA family transporter [Aeromicrobium sp. REDSEA-S38_B2]
MAVLLSLLSALSYGVSDFLGGLFSKRSGPWQTAVVGQTSSTVCTVAVALFIAGDPVGADWVWGVVGGAGSGVGAAFLYRGLAGGRMSVVAPLSAVVCALLPVAVGLVTGDRPSALALAGIVVAFPAIALVSRVVEEDAAAQAAHRGGVVDGVLAGLGVLMGPLGATATTAFLLATREGLLSVVSVISSLYPATTVLLATLVLKERIQAWQGVGLALAASAVTLVALG